MKLIVFILFCFLAFVYICEKGELSPKRAKAYLVWLWPIFILIAAFRSPLMPDYDNYELFFNSGNSRFEIGFVAVTQWIKMAGGNFFIFLAFFSGISIALKFIAINKMTKLVLASLLVYCSNIFILHDLIQMRCAIASGLLLLTVWLKVNKKWFGCVLSFIVAFLFHYSTLAFFIFLFLNVDKPHKYIFMGLIIVSYVSALAGATVGSLVSLLPFEFVQASLTMYEDNIYEEIDIFNILQLLRVFICFYLLYFLDFIRMHNRYATLLVKIYALSLSCLAILSDFPVVAFRVSELLLVVECLALPMIYYTLKGPEIIRKLPVILVSGIILVLNITKAELLV